MISSNCAFASWGARKPLTKKNKVDEMVTILFIIHSPNAFVNSKLI